MNATQRKRIEAAVIELIGASVDASWAGAGSTEDMPAVSEALSKAHAEYQAALNDATE